MFVALPCLAFAQSVEKWGHHDISLTAPTAQLQGNPFEVELCATFINGNDTLVVPGYYERTNRAKSGSCASCPQPKAFGATPPGRP